MKLLREDPDTSEDEHFRIMLVQTEVERVMFVVRSYLRTRLQKVRKRCLPRPSVLLTWCALSRLSDMLDTSV